MNEILAQTAGVPIVITIIIVALLLVVVILIGLRGRMLPTRSHCTGCRYQLHDPLPPRCPECGRELDQPRAIAWGTYAPRLRMVAWGVVSLIALMVGSTFVAGYVNFVVVAGAGQARADRALLRLSAEELTAQLNAAEPTDEIWQKMIPLINSPRFDDERVIAVGRAAIAAGRGSLMLAMQGEQMKQHIGSHIAGSVVNSEHLSDEQRVELIHEAFVGPVVAIPRLVPADSELRVIAAVPTVDHYFSSSFIGQIKPIIERVQIDGDDVPFTRHYEQNWPTIMAQLELPPDAESFELTVEAAFEVGLSEKIGPWARAYLHNGGIRLHHVSITERVQVIAPDAPFPQPLTDESLVAVVEDAIMIRHLALLPDIEPGRFVYELDLVVRPVEGVELSFDVFVQTVDAEGRPTRIQFGWTYRYRRGGAMSYWPTDVPRSSEHKAWAPAPGPEVRTVSVMFVPREPYRQMNGRRPVRDYYFNLPIRFDDVPLVRFDSDWLEGG